MFKRKTLNIDEIWALTILRSVIEAWAKSIKPEYFVCFARIDIRRGKFDNGYILSGLFRISQGGIAQPEIRFEFVSSDDFRIIRSPITWPQEKCSDEILTLSHQASGTSGTIDFFSGEGVIGGLIFNVVKIDADTDLMAYAIT